MFKLRDLFDAIVIEMNIPDSERDSHLKESDRTGFIYDLMSMLKNLGMNPKITYEFDADGDGYYHIVGCTYITQIADIARYKMLKIANNYGLGTTITFK